MFRISLRVGQNCIPHFSRKSNSEIVTNKMLNGMSIFFGETGMKGGGVVKLYENLTKKEGLSARNFKRLFIHFPMLFRSNMSNFIKEFQEDSRKVTNVYYINSETPLRICLSFTLSRICKPYFRLYISTI